jgi:hypothetical protein
MGKPPKGYVDFEFDLSEEEYEIIESNAAAAGISVQQLVDQCARGLARAIPTNENNPNDDDP